MPLHVVTKCLSMTCAREVNLVPGEYTQVKSGLRNPSGGKLRLNRG